MNAPLLIPNGIVEPVVRPAILSGWLYVPYEVIGNRAARDRLKRKLIFTQKTNDEPKRIELFHDWVEREYLGVPRAWGLNTFRGRVPLVDKTSMGVEINVPRIPSTNHPRCPDPVRQGQFITDLQTRFETDRSFIAEAATGSGKTVCALAVGAGHLRRRMLVLVHLERLMYQWVEEAMDKLGLPEDRIGIVQSDRCDWRGKDVVIGMLHSVAQREYERDFYKAFGTVFYDEVHKVGTEFFAPAVYRFNARYQMGLSATVERDDGGERVFMMHLGGIGVRSEAEALPMTVYPLRFSGKNRYYRVNPLLLPKLMSEDHERNMWLARQVKRLYDAGRQAVLVSYFVEHVQEIMYLAQRLGVPADRMGQYTGQRHGAPYSPVTTTRMTPDGREYTPIKWVLKGPGRVQGVPVFRPVLDEDGRPIINVPKIDIPGEELDRVKTTCQLVFATYGMLTEGINEPRWDAGLDLLPSKKATQLTGRIRRKVEGKKHPIWLTPYDEFIPSAVRKFNTRCRDYRKTGATIREIIK